MKKISIILCILLITSTLHAQFNKNRILLETYGSYGNSKTSEQWSVSNNGTIGAAVGKFLNNTTAWGISTGFDSYKIRSMVSMNSTDTSTYKSDHFYCSIFGRKFITLRKDFYFFTQMDAAYIGGHSKQLFSCTAISNSYNHLRGGFISLTPGISCRLYKKLHAEIVLPAVVKTGCNFYRFYSDYSKDTNTGKSFYFYSNLFSFAKLSDMNIGFFLLL